MLVPFAVDPEVFSNEYSQDELYRHKNLIDLWQKFGCLVLTGPSESQSRLLDAVRKAHPAVRKRWQVALKQLRRNCCVSDFDPNLNELPTDWLSSLLVNRVKVVSLEATRALCWGLSEDEYSLPKENSAEICRFGFESESMFFKNAQTLAQSPIDKGTTWSEVWAERIEPLAIESKKIVAVDRYALKSMMEHQGSSLSGLERLIVQLSGLSKGKPRTLRLITACPREWKSLEVQESFQRILDCQALLKGTALREVQIYLRYDNAFRDSSHHRYIRFDDFQILQLDTGLKPLAGEVVKPMCSTVLLPWQHEVCKPYHAAEKELIAAKSALEKRIAFL